jgi:hypothetical protein
MNDEVLMDNFQEDSASESLTCGLSKNEVIKLLYNQDSEVELIAPEKFKSPIWERFRIIFYKGECLLLFLHTVTRETQAAAAL